MSDTIISEVEEENSTTINYVQTDVLESSNNFHSIGLNCDLNKFNEIPTTINSVSLNNVNHPTLNEVGDQNYATRYIQNKSSTAPSFELPAANNYCNSNLFQPDIGLHQTISVHQNNSEFISFPDNQQIRAENCLICGDFASGRHYGVVSCEGCKGFFRRSVIYAVNNNNSYLHNTNGIPNIYKCVEGSHRCAIRSDKSRRRCCKSCRYQRCIMSGMNYDAIYYLDGQLSTLNGTNEDESSDDVEAFMFQNQLYRAFENNIILAVNKFRDYLRNVSVGYKIENTLLTCSCIKGQNYSKNISSEVIGDDSSRTDKFLTEIKVDDNSNNSVASKVECDDSSENIDSVNSDKPDQLKSTQCHCNDDLSNSSQEEWFDPKPKFSFIVAHLRIFSIETLRKFVSQIREFRKISYNTQTFLIEDSSDKLVLIILALIFNNVKSSITCNSIVFGDDKMHKNFLLLRRHIQILTDKMIQLLNANFNSSSNIDDKISQEMTDLSIKQSKGNMLNVPFFRTNYYCNLESNVNSLIENVENSHQDSICDEESVKIYGESFPQSDSSMASFDNLNLNDDSISVYSQTMSSTFSNNFSDISEKTKLLRLKEKFRFLPILIILLITSIPRNISVQNDKKHIMNIRDNILDLYMNDHSWMYGETTTSSEKQVDHCYNRDIDPTRSLVQIVDQKSSSFTKSDVQSASISNIFITIHESLFIVNRLSVLFKRKF